MKKQLAADALNFKFFLPFIFCGLLFQTSFSQTEVVEQNTINQAPSNFQLRLNSGYDFIPSYTSEFTYYDVKGGPKFGLGADYYFGKIIGVGLDADFLINKPISLLDGDYYVSANNSFVAADLQTDVQNINRIFVGLGPSFRIPMDKFQLSFAARVGMTKIKGGELASFTESNGSKDYHLLFSGFDETVLSYKGSVDLSFSIAKNLNLGLGVYYLRHSNLHPDQSFSLVNVTDPTMIYGHSSITQERDGQIKALGQENAYMVKANVEEIPCATYSSIGATIGLLYKFGKKTKKEKPIEPIETCKDCKCPNDGHKVVVTVRDEQSNKVIPDADVAIRDSKNNIIATGRTNTFGVVDFGEIPHGNYTIVGNVYGMETPITRMTEEEFLPNAILQKVVIYNDLRFILKGSVVNKSTGLSESNVVVSLTNTSTGAVVQNTSNEKGQFNFRLDKNSSYELVGIKENRLSDVGRTSTIGLNRSATLFVNLILGVEDFECNRGMVLDIKYEFDKDNLLSESMFDLDKLVRYLQAHKRSKVELSSHTDSRGSNSYNMDLSQRRAQSAVNYIMSKGINRSRITALGYGETKLKNHCADGIDCSEDEHRTNRRTEAKLICN